MNVTGVLYTILICTRLNCQYFKAICPQHNQLLYSIICVYIFIFCAALCPDPADPVNGMVTFTGNSINDTATYSCNMGFELVGSASATCTQVDVNTAAFSPVAPVCRRKLCIQVHTCEWCGNAPSFLYS